MSKLSKLLQVTEEEKKKILQHYDLSEEDFDERVNMLKEWTNKCEHLPKEDVDNKFRIALLNCKMSLEKAKKSLEGYYRIRSRYSNEIFDKMTPKTKEYLESKKLVKTVVMPNLTPDLHRITIFKVSDPNGEACDAFLYELPVLMMAEIRLITDLFISNIIIIDFDGYSWKNVLKYTPTVQQKLVDILMSVNLRIHSIHFINQTNFMDYVMRLLKSLLPSKLVNKIHNHQSYDELKEHLSAENLPSNYGGKQKSIEVLHEEWCEQIEESDDLFQKLLSVKSTEKIELDQTQQDLFGCGAEGSFRKLTLD
ncbi:uncharacterized protein LOC126740269 [Anthonomus grandis grandis]|uniref:uncharacterized protein LOC126740269 n=1 Tax=Anthonomus grandis grandis TaxID=2921223 RepID=UPI0021651ECF|nr:uncharacterized protein LOC126740269 [Anthonomus grandis grandis]